MITNKILLVKRGLNNASFSLEKSGEGWCILGDQAEVKIRPKAQIKT